MEKLKKLISNHFNPVTVKNSPEKRPVLKTIKAVFEAFGARVTLEIRLG